jgi:DNA-binding transcriptional ArsR family regulator
MVEYVLSLDNVFSSLADPTRRDILRRVAVCDMTVSEVAGPYNLTFAAISKHLKVLERARLVVKRRHGKQQIVQIAPEALREATNYLSFYEGIWNDRFDALTDYLNKEN